MSAAHLYLRDAATGEMRAASTDDFLSGRALNPVGSLVAITVGTSASTLAALMAAAGSSIQCEESGNGAEQAVMGCNFRRCSAAADRKNRLSLSGATGLALDRKCSQGLPFAHIAYALQQLPFIFGRRSLQTLGLCQLLRQRRRREVFAAKSMFAQGLWMRIVHDGLLCVKLKARGLPKL